MGWAYHIQWADGAATEKADALGNGTNNKAELLAAIDGLKATPTGSLVLILTDSNYVRRGATEWSTDWVENNWKNAKKKPVANKELWIELLAIMETRQVTVEREAGHSGDPMNDHVDALARTAAEDWKDI
jgi:ribonuclease HI